MTFFFDQKNATTALQDRRSRGSHTGFGENFSASLNATELTGQSLSEKVSFADAYDPVIAALNEGRKERKKFPNPYSRTISDPLYGPTWRSTHSQGDIVAMIWAEIAARRAADPTALKDIPDSAAALKDQIYKAAVASEKRVQKDAATATTLGKVGQFAGAMVGVLEDPAVALSNLVGASRGAGIARAVAIEALAGSGSEALVQPDIQAYRAKLGLDAGPKQALTAIATAGVASGLFAGALKGGGRVAGRLARSEVVRLAPEKLLKAFDDLIKKPTAEERAAMAVLEADVTLRKDNPLDGRAGADEHRARAAEAVSAAEDGALPTMNVRPAMAMRPRPADAADNLDGLVYAFNPDDLQIDAKMFQFKHGGDDAGVTDRLHGVTTWDPVKAGQVLVYEFADGRRFVADGHQRVALAKRIKAQGGGHQIKLIGQILREANGYTPEMARVVAAMKNVAEGTGTAIDAAKVLRVAPEHLSGLPPRSELVRQAQHLVNLSDETFGMVVNEVVPAHYAALVGRLIPSDHKLQFAAMDVLAKADPKNTVQAEAKVRQVMNIGTISEKQVGLFGEEMLTRSLIRERAKILDLAIKRLRKDKTVFKTLVSNAGDIAKAGNRLADTENLKRVMTDEHALQTIQTLANRKGPLSDALEQSARVAAESGKYGDAVAQFVAAVRDAAARGDFEGATIGGSGRTVDAQSAHRGAATGGHAAPVRPADEQAGLSGFADPGGKAATDQADLLGREAEINRQAGVDQPMTEIRGETGSSTPSSASRSAEAAGASNNIDPSMDPSGTGTHIRATGSHDTMRAPSSVFSSRATTPPSHLGTKIELGDINPTSKNRIYQATDDFNKIYTRAEEIAPALEAYLKDVSDTIPGAEFYGARIKDAGEMQEKLRAKGVSASEASDYLGGRIVVDDWASMDVVLRDLKASGRAFAVEDFLDHPRSGGYRAVHLQLFEDKGISAEIQIQPRELRAAQEKVHHIYAKWRRKSHFTPEELILRAREQDEVDRVFSEAWRKFIDRVGPRPAADSRVPVGLVADADGTLTAVTRSMNDVLDEIDRETNFLDGLDGCLK